MHWGIAPLVMLSLTAFTAAWGQPMSAVPLGAEIRLWTLDSPDTVRQMYLIGVRGDTLVLKDVVTGASANVRRTALARLDVYTPRRRRIDRARLYSAYGFLGGGLLGALAPSNTISSDRGSAAMMTGFGVAVVAWLIGFGQADGRWQPVTP